MVKKTRMNREHSLSDSKLSVCHGHRSVYANVTDLVPRKRLLQAIQNSQVMRKDE
jgi:hypothetical protein